ncbi:hypothetical protein FD755_008585 [Muntiacus reevesi]|uniref:Lipid droplet-associated hydrolase n=1 Tax=Muntiacus reevesi TaxID=9886 RepID=A0A5J5MNB6_MUNRE|nr:hypothetical protein FD755_008585 [Muntiacus reevesi]
MDSEIKEEIPVHEEFILCCGVETQVLKCGPWTDLINNQRGTRPKLLIFIIPDPNAEEVKDIYGLRGQVEHKLAFLRTQVPKEMKLVIIGHSIGSYFSLEILKHAPELPNFNAAYLGSQEMREVVKRDNETIKEHLPKLIFYYGTADGWCPREYYDDIKKDFPEGDIRLCEKKIPHAFILSFFQEVANMVADWLKDDLSKM